MNYFRMRNQRKKQSNYIYESRTEYDIDGKKNFDIKLGGAYAVDLKAYHGEKN